MIASSYFINVPICPDPYHLAPVCAASSKLSTWLLLGGLVEQAIQEMLPDHSNCQMHDNLHLFMRDRNL